MPFTIHEAPTTYLSGTCLVHLTLEVSLLGDISVGSTDEESRAWGLLYLDGAHKTPQRLQQKLNKALSDITMPHPTPGPRATGPSTLLCLEEESFLASH